MSSALLIRGAATTLRLLTKYGKAIGVERKVTGGQFNPTTGMNSAAPSTASTPARAIATNISQSDRATDFWSSLSAKYSHVRKLVLAAKGMTFAPAPGDSIPSFEGSPWTIAPDGVRAVNPDGDTPIAYEVWAVR